MACCGREPAGWGGLPRFFDYPYGSPYSDYGYLHPGGSGWYYYPTSGLTFTPAAMKQRQAGNCGRGQQFCRRCY